MIFSNGSPKEPFAPITGGGAIVLAGRSVATDSAVLTEGGCPRRPYTTAGAERRRQRVIARHCHLRIRCNKMHPK